MKRFLFRHYLAHLETLTGTQRQQVIAALQRPDPGGTVPHQVRARERRLADERRCIHCGATGTRKHGKSAGLMRFRCLAEGCGKTYTALTGTGLAKLRHRGKWPLFQECLRQRTTLQEAANRCGIGYRTAFLWRHRFLAEARALAPLCGVVEMDETFFAESAKGDRTLRRRRPPRKRGGLRGQRGLSHAQQPIMTAVARGGETYAWHSFATGAVSVTVTMRSRTNPDTVIVSDAHRSYAAATRQLERPHEVINRSHGERVRGRWHLNTVNNRHQTMKTTLNRWHRGVGTKYLDNYMNWLMRQEFRPDKTIEPDFIRDHMQQKQQLNT
ncbi:MAG: IS1595 family transposase [Gammaproteobacteria bacterium]|nr:IS1595 family transposase [Gammaproteobacteria bacterium]